MSAVPWLEQHAARVPDREAVVDLATGHTVTYRELHERVRSIAHVLVERFGVGNGDRVAILSRNDQRVLETIYACGLVGAVAVPLNWRLTPAELRQIVDDAEPMVVVGEDWCGDVIDELAATAVSPLVTVVWSSDRAGRDEFEDVLIAPVPEGWAAPPVSDDDVWTIIYTSGTTGRPKGVQATHRGWVASLLGILVAHGISSSSRSLTVLPTFHVAGLNLFTHPVLFAGGTVLLARTFDADQTLDLLRDAEPAVTHFCGVPANYQFMQGLPTFDDRPLRPFVAVVGGSPVPVTLVTSWRDRGVPLCPVFGITEAGACVTAVPPGRVLDAPGVVGVPVLHARCRVRGSEGQSVAAGEVGELQVSGDVVTTGYWRNAEATRQAFTDDGWLRTGDAAAIGSDGSVVLVDRWKDMYISGGENVYPAEVEQVVGAHAAVAQVAVVGVPDDRWGETGVAFVMLRPGHSVAAGELQEWCTTRLARYKLPSQFRVVDDLPRNATGKTLKHQLRAAVVDAPAG